ncbi:hypothetical protein [Saccharothrix hoggarensis]|uniref:Uncharacterized protein n=1 Tax=Saccharothrix hoggarensis TaxID=913853 RepID=A0ABW3QZT6_9PSEU
MAIGDCNGGADQNTATQHGVCLDVHNQATANGAAVTLRERADAGPRPVMSIASAVLYRSSPASAG